METKEQAKQSPLINIPQLLNAYKRNWIWVMVSVVAFIALGLVQYKKAQPRSEVLAQVLISDEGSKASSSMSELASMFSGSSFGANRSVEDEMVIICAHSVLKKTVEDLDLNVRYSVKKNIIQTLSVYSQPPVKLIYDKSIADTLGIPINFKIDVDTDGNTKIVARGYKNKVIGEFNDLTLPATIELPQGSFTFEVQPSYDPEKHLTEKVSLSSYDSAALALGAEITADFSQKKTDIIMLSYLTPDASFGKKVLNTLIHNYNNLTIKQKQDFNQKTLQFLEERIAILSEEVNLTEEEVENFMDKRDLVNPNAQAGIILSRTTSQEVELIKSENEYELLTMAIEFLGNEANNTSMLPIMPSIASLTPLIEGYNALILERLNIEASAKGNNMALKAINDRINVVKDNLLTALNKQSETSQFEINELRRQYALSKKKLETVPGIEREYTNILRKQTLKEQLYVFLLRQREETEMAIAGAHPRGVIIDEAFVTDSIIGMSPKVVIMAFLIIGLLFPGGIFILRWILSKRIMLQDQMHDLSGLDTIAQVPLNSDENQPQVIHTPDSLTSRRMRLLRSNLLSIPQLSRQAVIAVTGTTANNASALVAVNLSAALAATARKVILVDTNVFNPMIADLLRLEGTPTMKEIYVGNRYKTNHYKLPGDAGELDVITCCKDLDRGSDLIASIAFADMIEALKSSYEYVIISAPDVKEHFASAETVNNLSTCLIATAGCGETLKADASRLKGLEHHDGQAFIVNITNE